MSISPILRLSRRSIPHQGLLAAAAAFIAIEAYGALGRAAGVPLRAGLPGAHSAEPITAASFALGVAIAAFWGTLTAAVLAQRAARPARVFTTIAMAVTLISLVTPLDAAHAAVSTRVTLAGGHLLVAGIMTAILRTALPVVRN